MALREKSTQAWIGFYIDRYKKSFERFLGISLPKVKPNPYQQVMLAEIRPRIEEVLKEKGQATLLSAGSGIDIIAFHLKKGFHERIRIVLLDISSECLRLNRKMFGDKVDCIEGDVFGLDNHRNRYDIVYNTGLLEHFSRREQRKIIGNISHVLKPGGFYITLNPYAGGRIYTQYMELAKRKGIWEYGEESPIATLNPFSSEEFQLVNEYPCCSIIQLAMLKYRGRVCYYTVFLLIAVLYRFLFYRRFDDWAGRYIGYYGLISVFKKRNTKSRFP